MEVSGFALECLLEQVLEGVTGKTGISVVVTGNEISVNCDGRCLVFRVAPRADGGVNVSAPEQR